MAKRGDLTETETLLLAALEDLGGAALILDRELRVVAGGPEARRLVGTSIPKGVSAIKLLCGGAAHRPIAEALAQGVAVEGRIDRPSKSGSARSLGVSAHPLNANEERVGWVLWLREEREVTGDEVLFHGMWTRDAGMKRAFHVMARAARGDATVLVRGETGTGKELVARAIHDLSPRRAGPFAAINCAALSASLLESELFGHVRGAFTGAVRDQPGFFRAADQGTLFLDEVAEMPVELQAKLLRALETRAVIPVGGRSPIAVDVRVIAATHESLRAAVEAGRFRSDLMYRLRVIPIFLPPLRDRTGDVALLTRKVIDELNTQGGRHVARVSPEAALAMERYPWLGNVRELRNALEYAFVIGDGPVLRPEDLPGEIARPEAASDAWSSRAVVNAAPVFGDVGGDGDVELAAERARILQSLERAGGHRERAAQILGISRVTLWRRMRELGLG